MTATYTAPKTMGAEPTIYSDWNTYVRDNIEFFKSKIDTYEPIIVARAYKTTTAQVTVNGILERVELNAETFDTNSNFDTTTKIGSATSTSANHLVNTSGNFTSADVGKQIWNTTDNTYAKVTIYNSATDLTLDGDIMANGENYRLYASQFTATVAGYYNVIYSVDCATVVANSYHELHLYKNDLDYSYVVSVPGKADVNAFQGHDLVYLNINDYIYMVYRQYDGANRNITASTTTFMSVELKRV